MIVSASQLETHADCARKWFFASRKKLPQLPKGSTSIGIVLHGVAERWHKADDLGRAENGHPVELFPAGWATDDKGETISPADQLMVQEMVKAAIEGGVWERLPGRKVEWGFMLPVIDDVDLMGFVDVLMPDAIWDHKTTSKKRYAKSARAIADSAQMNIYAKALTVLREMEGAPPLSVVQLRHNTFIFETAQARKTVAEVEIDHVHRYWESAVVPRVQKMQKQTALQDWHDFEPPPPDACMKYGGCPFMSICGGKETVEQYSSRVLRTLQVTATVRGTKTPQQNRSDMSVSDKLAKLKRSPSSTPAAVAVAPAAPAPAPTQAPKAAAATATAPASVATAPVTVAPATAQKLQLATGAAPWAKPNCVACQGTGFNSKGGACQICSGLSRKLGGPVPENYDIVVEDGFVAWQPKEGGTPVATQALTATPTTTEKVVAVATPAPKVVEAPVENPTEPKETPAPKIEPDPVENPKEPKEGTKTEEAPVENPEEPKDTLGIARTRGRMPRGYRLFINCAPSGGKQKRADVKTIDQIFSAIRDQIVTDSKSDSFYAMPAFGHGKEPGRRDLACAYLEKQISSIGQIDIVCSTDSPDVRALVDVLRGYADEVVESIAR